ncbi:hypothetical protein Patl1_19612 [Pistacia atlantica]|uniref:Uncharacterized protein n=1 Tax=Pistacia atlantica TaxID=434234 RepID=A0ACC1C3J7_9ROSI|nr:hypothetical protein Patl1_19612 [Pistacia atlantica]
MSATRLFLFTTFSRRTPNHKSLSLIPPRFLAQRFNFSSLRFRRYSSSVAVDAFTVCNTDSAKLSETAPYPLLPRPASNPVQQKKQVKFVKDELLQDVEMKRGDWMCLKIDMNLTVSRGKIRPLTAHVLKPRRDTKGTKMARGCIKLNIGFLCLDVLEDFVLQKVLGFQVQAWRCNFYNFARNLICLKCKEDGPKSVRGGDIEMKDGDWICSECNFMHFSRSMRCLKCRAWGPKRLAVDRVEVKKGDWNCPQCNFMNFSRNTRCLKCKAWGPKRLAVDEVEVRKGEWNCPQCFFMNFARNKNCLRCREQRPNRLLYHGEWDCPSCDFLNYSKNEVCLKCKSGRPKEDATEYEEQISKDLSRSFFSLKMAAIRRASTLTSFLLSRTLASTTTSSSVATTVHRRFLSSDGISDNCGSYSRRSAGAVSLGFAGALAAGASLSFQEVYAKEPPPADLVPKDVVLYQYEACPFCNKVKAFLDYYDIPYKVVEVNPLSKKEIKWSDYKKVPILMVDGEQLVDSSAIIDKLGHTIIPEKMAVSASEDDEETKWRRWVDNHLVHVLSPNIYRNTSEALESFDYITSNGNFGFTEKITVKYAGAAAMYFVSKKLKKKYNITDERAALYEAAETWVDALDGRDFLGGSKPNLADLAVFGVLRPIRHLRSGRDMVEHTRIGDWYTRMENVVGESSRIKA